MVLWSLCKIRAFFTTSSPSRRNSPYVYRISQPIPPAHWIHLLWYMTTFHRVSPSNISLRLKFLFFYARYYKGYTTTTACCRTQQLEMRTENSEHEGDFRMRCSVSGRLSPIEMLMVMVAVVAREVLVLRQWVVSTWQKMRLPSAGVETTVLTLI